MKRNWAVRILVLLTSVSLMLGGLSLISVARPYWSGSVLPGRISTPSSVSDKAVNILIAGIGEEDGAALAQNVMLLNLDMETGDAGIMYLPGCTLVGESCVRYGRLSGAYNWGTEDDPQGGARALAECVSDCFVIPVDRYFMFDMSLLPDMADRLGGVRVTLEEGVTLEDGTELEAGDHIFHVQDVYSYILPQPGDDSAELNAVRAGFMRGLISAILGMPAREALALAKDNRDSIDTDISVRDHIKLSKALFQKSGSQIDYFMVPGRSVSGYGNGRLPVWSVRRADAAALINDRIRAYTDHILAEDMSLPEIPAQ